MKPKTITEILDGFATYCRWYGYDEGRGEKGRHTSSEPEDMFNKTVAQIQQLLEECVPEKKTVKDDLASMTLQERYIDLKHEGFNQAIDQYKSNIRGKLK